jgi:hypothetical protein
MRWRDTFLYFADSLVNGPSRQSPRAMHLRDSTKTQTECFIRRHYSACIASRMRLDDAFAFVVKRDDVLWLLGSLCGLFRIPFDASLIGQDYPPAYSLATLHEAARALEIKPGH